MSRWVTVTVILLLATFALDSTLAESPESPAATKLSRKKTLAYSRKIDALIKDHLARKEQSPNKAIDESTFLRRIYLTAIGRIPNIEEADAFLGSDASQKRSDLIDELLDSYGYVLSLIHI